MSLLRKIHSNRAALTEVSSLTAPGGWIYNWMGAGNGGMDAGENVTPKTSMQVTAVYCAVAIISEIYAMLPLEVTLMQKNGKKKAMPDHPVSKIFQQAAHDQLTAFELKDTMQGHVLLRGNAYAQKLRNGIPGADGKGTITGLAILHPDRMHPVRDGQNLIYKYITLDGKQLDLTPDDVFHFRGRSDDGLIGMSPIQECARAIGLAIATERHGARLFGSAARPDGAIKHQGKVSKQAQENLKESWKEKYSGAGNSHGIAIFEEGMDWVQIGMRNDEAQFIETRGLQVEEIARIFKLSKHMLNNGMDKSQTNLEQRFKEFLLVCLKPWLIRWKQSIELQLLTKQERDRGLQVRFLENMLLGGSQLEQMQFFTSGRQWGIFNADEVRAELGYDPIEDDGGEEYLRPVNMQIIGEPLPDTTQENVEPQNVPQPEPIKNLADPNPKRSGVKMAFQAVNPKADARLRSAFEKILADDFGRVRRLEAKEIERNARKIAKSGNVRDFWKWENEFYNDHHDHIVNVISNGVSAFLIARGSELDAREISHELASRMIKASRAGLIACEDDDPAIMFTNLEKVTGVMSAESVPQLAADAVSILFERIKNDEI